MESDPDLRIPVSPSRILAKALRRAGARFHYEEIEAGGYDGPLDLEFEGFLALLDVMPPSPREWEFFHHKR